MRKYLHKFESLADFETAYNGSDYHEPWVSLTKGDVDSKIKLTIGYSGNPECVLNYVENASITLNGEAQDVYIWQIESGNEGMGYLNYSVGDYVATNEKEAGEYNYDEGKSIVAVMKSGDQWVTSGEYPNTNTIWKIETVSGPMNKVDYNKRAFDGDLIIDCAQSHSSDYPEYYDCRIIYAAPELGLIPDSEFDSPNEGGYRYLFNSNSPIGPSGTRTSMKVRVLNYEQNPIDVNVNISHDYERARFSSDQISNTRNRWIEGGIVVVSGGSDTGNISIVGPS